MFCRNCGSNLADAAFCTKVSLPDQQLRSTDFRNRFKIASYTERWAAAARARVNRDSAHAFAVIWMIIGLLNINGWCQKISIEDRDAAQVMLREISADVKKHYYDPRFHGVDWEAKVEEMKERIKTTDSLVVALSAVAEALNALDDSHTFFVPPNYSYRYDYGWQARMVGDRCFVIRVRPGSDAESKGVKPGDELLTLDGLKVNRESFLKMLFARRLQPKTAQRLELRDPTGKQRQVEVTTIKAARAPFTNTTSSGAGNFRWEMTIQAQNAKYFWRERFAELNDDVSILKLPGFFFGESEVKGMIDKARKHAALVVDLRGNHGGRSETLKYLVAGIFENEVKIGDRNGRSEHKPLIVKPSSHPFAGKLVVLVDSDSASAAELFARVVQIEKRGTVIGDRTSGSVMEANYYPHRCGVGTAVFYGAAITEADIVMTDGKSLEHIGVLPDEIMLPSAEDLASGRDPVLARAAEIAGAKLSDDAAGKLFPYEWPSIGSAQ